MAKCYWRKKSQKDTYRKRKRGITMKAILLGKAAIIRHFTRHATNIGNLCSRRWWWAGVTGRVLLVATMLWAVEIRSMADVEVSKRCLTVTPTYQAVWRPGTTNETLIVGESWDSFIAKDRELRPQGWRLHQINTNVLHDCYGKETGWTFDVLWRLEGNIEEFAVFAWKLSDFVSLNKDMREQGYRMTLIDSFVSRNETLFNVVWRRSSANQIDIYGSSFNDFVNKTNALGKQGGWFFHLIDAYRLPDGSPRYNASWRRGNVGEIWIIGWAPQHYENKYAELHSQGWNLSGLTGFFNGRFDAFWHYTGVYEIRQTYMDRTAFLLAQKANLGKGLNIYLFERNS
jgi:Bacterial tandem repeat domain 1